MLFSLSFVETRVEKKIMVIVQLKSNFLRETISTLFHLSFRMFAFPKINFILDHILKFFSQFRDEKTHCRSYYGRDTKQKISLTSLFYSKPFPTTGAHKQMIPVPV